MGDTIGSVGVEIVPDARGFTEKLRAQIRDVGVTVNADADTTEAEAQLDEVARTRTAKIKADTSQLSKGASELDKFVGNLGLLPALAISAGAALVPLAATLGGIAAALAAPLAIAGGGATLFGVLAGFAVKDTEKQLKLIDASQKKLDGLTKGTKDYAAEQKHLHDLQKSLSPAQSKFAASQGNLSGSFQNFIGGKAGTALLGPLTQGMNLLSSILPHLTPILVAASGAFSDLLGGISNAVNSSGFDKFIHTVSGQVGHDIEGFGKAAGNIATGLGGLFVVLDKSVGGNMVDTLVRLTGAFSHWANSAKGRNAVQSFLDYFHQVGPQVGTTIGHVATALGHVVEALAPLGPPTLRVIQGIADAISNIPVPVLTAMAGAFVGLTAFQKVGGFKVAGALGGLAGRKGGIVGAIAGKAGVVPVFVTNPGFGGGAGGGILDSAAGRLAKKVGGVAVGSTTVGAIGTTALAIGGLATITIGSAVLTAVALKMESASGKAPDVAGMTPGQTQEFNRSRLNQQFPGEFPNYRAQQAAHQQFPGEFKSDASRADVVAASATRAYRALDQIGPHAAQASAVASRAIAAVQAHLNALHDKKIQIIAQTASAISSLERLQAMTIRDKSFNVIQNNIERTVGPGGGMQRHAKGGWITGPGTGTSDSIPSWLSRGEFVVPAAVASQNRALIDQMMSGRSHYSPPPSSSAAGSAGMPNVAILRVGERDFTAHLEMVSDGVYRANTAYNAARAGL